MPSVVPVDGSLDIPEQLAPGRYALKSDTVPIDVPVLVVRYATQAITGVDGRYRIEQVPLGKAKLNAYLPSIQVAVAKDIIVQAGDNVYDIDMP